MSFLKIFFRFFVAIVIAALIGFFIARELLLWWAGQQIKGAAQALVQPVRFQETARSCFQGSSAGESPIQGYQLRFVSDRAFRLEAVCTASEPAFYKGEDIVWPVRKTTGSAGLFTVGDGNISGEFTLTLWGQNRLISFDNSTKTVLHKWGKSSLLSDVVWSSCQAHGLRCCDELSQQGEGERWSRGVTDCPQQCFTSCSERPVILSFRTQPAPTGNARTVQVAPDEASITFAYQIESKEDIQSIILDFGDGEKMEYTSKSKKITHDYNCAQPECRYEASLSILTVSGLAEAATPLRSMTIVVTNANTPYTGE